MSSPTETAPPAAELGSLRARADAFRRERCLREWDNLAHGIAAAAGPPHARHGALFAPPALESVRRALAAAPDEPDEARSLEMLHAHLLRLRVERATSDLDDRLAVLEAGAVVECDGVRLPYRAARVETWRERDPQRRHRLQRAQLPVLEQGNALRVERHSRAVAESQALGLSGFVELCGRVRQCDLRALAPLAERILQASGPEYRRLFGEVVERESGVAPEQARLSDLGYAIRGGRYERYFDPARLFPSLEATLLGMGIHVASQGGLLIDGEDRPAKSARAFCMPVSVPGDVRISFRARGTPFDYDALYHEMGHAQQHLHNRESGFEFLYLGSMAVGETYALLFEGLTAAAGWLRRSTRLPGRQRQELRTMRAFRLLFLLRRYAAMLLYELRLYDGGLAKGADAYDELNQRALGVSLEEPDRCRYLADLDDYFYGVEYLRGWLLEAVLEKVLRVKYGEDWFDHKGAGAYLARLWEKGGRHRAEDLLEKLGGKGWGPEVFLQRARSLCEGA